MIFLPYLPSSDTNSMPFIIFFRWDHLWSNMDTISGPGSFEVQFGNHLQSAGIICGAVQTDTTFQIRHDNLSLSGYRFWTTYRPSIENNKLKSIKLFKKPVQGFGIKH